MLRLNRIFVTAFAVFALAAPSWAGILAFGGFSSNQPTAIKTFAPGEIFTITLTANTSDTRGVLFSTPFALNPNAGGQFQIVPGGTCLIGTPYLNGSTCTVLVKFTGQSPGNFNSDLLGQCQLGTAVAAGGYSINCNFNSSGTGQQGILGRFAGLGVAAGVDALGSTGFATLLLAVLGMGAFFTLRRR